MKNSFSELDKFEAGRLIKNGQTVGFSGFTPAGAAKVVPEGIAAYAKEEHTAGRPYKIGVITGASTGDGLDGVLTRAEAIAWRTPYQTNKDLRDAVNAGKIRYFDLHLSEVAQDLRYGFLGHVDWAVIEACKVTPEGEITLTTSVGVSPTLCRVADKIIIELNSAHPEALQGCHDIIELDNPPHRREIRVYSVNDRGGSTIVKVDPRKIVGIVKSNIGDQARTFADADETTNKIGMNVAEFLATELKAGRLPPEFLPLQSGVGNIANALMGALGKDRNVPPFTMYSEVIQDSVAELIFDGRVTFASGTSLTVTPEILKRIYENLDFFRQHFVLRPQEISNNPGVVRRLGVISINTAIEADIFGNINSTHIMGDKMMNGIGGSGDFTRNAYLSIFTCPSTTKNGDISTIVPLCSHIDHTEHSVKVVITEQGVADLRGKDPVQRATEIITKCAHPDYREELLAYVKDNQKRGHIPQNLREAFKMHIRFMETKSMKKKA
jgi:acetyl-CoA hydrolase